MSAVPGQAGTSSWELGTRRNPPLPGNSSATGELRERQSYPIFPWLKKLPYPDHLVLDAALGWLMLGDAQSAQEELAKLSPASRARPDVLGVEWSAHALKGNWREAYEVAQRLVSNAPDQSVGWIHRAYALRRMPEAGLPRAWEALRPAAEKFPREFLIPYNLSCYAAQLGRLEESWEWLQRAVQSAGNAETIKKMALADADLERLWPRIKDLSKS